MSGLLCAFDLKQKCEVLKPQVLEMAKKISHRGEECNGIYDNDNALMVHYGSDNKKSSSRSFSSITKNEQCIIVGDGVIYNLSKLRAYVSNEKECEENGLEILLELYEKKGVGFLDDLNGQFAFAIYDVVRDDYLIARDHMGIVPLYMGYDQLGTVYIASELKALEGVCKEIQLFPPGHYLCSQVGRLKKYYQREWTAYDKVKNNHTSINNIKTGLTAAVKRQMTSDVPYGVLLSGGLDSSIVSALVKLHLNAQSSKLGDKKAIPHLHSFSVGLEGSPDLAAAKTVAQHIGTIHHEIKFTVQQGLEVLRDVIYHLETYDITTIRASTPMYLMARTMKSLGIKMVLSGEGADELFGGYLYFHKAPSPREFHEETVRKLNKLHMYDCLRANKSLAAWGIECRVPFLDKEFMDVAMHLNPKDKMITTEKMEKWVLRKVFEDILPYSVVWRQKEQFSDGVGYGWIDNLKLMTAQIVSDEDLANAKELFPIQTPRSKEEFYYRMIFSQLFPSDTAALCVPQESSVACSTQIALDWDEAFKNLNDPSGRAVSKVHSVAY